MRSELLFVAVAVLAILGLVALPVVAQTVYPEIEPNENKPQALANGLYLLTAGDSITGTMDYPSADYFWLQTASQSLGIYRNQLQVVWQSWSSSAVPYDRIQGRTQTSGAIDPSSNVMVQSNYTVATSPQLVQYNAWYGFGKGEQLFWVVGGNSTTLIFPYTATFTRTPITPADIGTFSAGLVTITTEGQVGASNVNTDLWVYDAGFNAIAGYGNDDAFNSTSVQSTLARTYNPGTYYLAISDKNLANNLPSPADDDDRNQPVLDYPDAVVNSSTALWLINVAFTDSSGTSVFQVPKSQPLQIVWLKFTVVSPFSFFLSQPSGAAGDLIFTNGGGTPGNPYLNAISLTAGGFPNGWFYGVDIPFNLLVTEYLFGSPFSGTLNVVGGALGSIPGPLPPGLQLFSVGVEFLPSYNVFRNSPPFIYTIL